MSDGDSPPASPAKNFILPEVGSPLRSEDEVARDFKAPDAPHLEDFSPTTSRTEKQPARSEPLPATQLEPFKTYDIDDSGLVETAQTLLRDHENLILPEPNVLREPDDPSPTDDPRCPMCKRPVDLEELRQYGEMNTRQQEAFCRSHQRRNAKDNWNSKGYPEIAWDMLDARISKHHSFIKELIDGGSSHYRDVLAETVKAGKDRNLLKSTSNLTPGYYGSRGLRFISENIVHVFTPLLKKRVVKDRLMAARGVTGFVQSVLVPEVTVLLIMEDMNVDTKKARTILTESSGMGELVNEEIKDVVPPRVEDSDNDD